MLGIPIGTEKGYCRKATIFQGHWAFTPSFDFNEICDNSVLKKGAHFSLESQVLTWKSDLYISGYNKW